jgi:hypothetical protein
MFHKFLGINSNYFPIQCSPFSLGNGDDVFCEPEMELFDTKVVKEW